MLPLRTAFMKLWAGGGFTHGCFERCGAAALRESLPRCAACSFRTASLAAASGPWAVCPPFDHGCGAWWISAR
eukprot:2712860-Prymnesium_polylepis.1